MIRLSVPNIGDDEVMAVERILRSGQLVHGEENERFETELSAYLGAPEVVVVSSGTAALHVALAALGIGPGDAVIVPDFTFPATANVVELLGARPVFVDVEPGTYCLSVEGVRRAIADWSGPQSLKALMPVHEFGAPADMTPLMALAAQHGLHVIEDAACALGATIQGKRAGTLGVAGCFSFHPRKALTTGEGGAVVTSDPDLAKRLRLLRNHGIERGPMGTSFAMAGFNYRMTNFQAALGRVQLRKFDGWLSARRTLKDVYLEALGDIPGFSLPADLPGHSWQTFMGVLDASLDRGRVIERLKAAGIEANLGAQSVWSQPYYRDRYGPVSESWTSVRLFRQGLALPFCETMSPEQLRLVAATLRAVAEDTLHEA